MLQRWRFSWAWFIGATLILGACSGNLPPIGPQPPPSCPEQCPLGSECKDPAKGCQPIPAPGPVCEPGQGCGCWHWPPDSTTWLYACCVPAAPSGVINVVGGPAQCPSTPPPVDPPPVDPPPVDPPPATGTNCDGEPGSETGETTANYGQVVNEEIAKLTGCSIGSRCVLGDTTQQQFLRAVVNAVRARGLCSGQHEPGVTDEIAVSSDPRSKREGYHCFAGDDSPGPLPPGAAPRTVVWSPGSARPSYYAPSGPPPVDPPPVAGCSAPLPPKVWTTETLPPGFDPALVGQTRYVMTCGPHNNVIDCTVQNQRACDYCEAIGMGEMGGQIRCGCPVRNECPGFKCEERPACEKYLTGGTVLESRNGATCEFAGGNPFMFKASGGNCRLCGVNGTTYNGQRQGCGGWF